MIGFIIGAQQKHNDKVDKGTDSERAWRDMYIHFWYQLWYIMIWKSFQN